MTKKKKIIIAVTAVLLVLTALILIITLRGCNRGEGAFVYDNSGKYTAGEWSESLAVSSLDIEWLEGEVRVVSSVDLNTLTISESADEELDVGVSMHYYFDGGILRIKPCASGTRIDKVPEKTLTVYLPIGYSLTDLDITTSGADIIIEEAYSPASFMELSSSSGRISLDLLGSSKELLIKNDSGRVDFTHKRGRISYFSLEGKTGEVSLDLAEVPTTSKVKTGSGNILITLSENAGYKLNYSVGSGSYSSEFEGEKTEGGILVGSGGSSLTVTTSTGKLSIKKAAGNNE